MCSSDLATGKCVALVVGNSNHTAFITLGSNPRNDAADSNRALQGFGFSVTTRKDATRRDLNSALANFGRAASRSEAVLFCFAGQGIQIRSNKFLMLVNATAESKIVLLDEGVSLSPFLHEMKGRSAVKFAPPS